MEPFSLRPARPDELEKLIAIDDETSELYAEAGLAVALSKDHPFVRAESERWAKAIARSLAYVAVEGEDQPVGFMTLGFVDGEPYLDQLSVRPIAMRRGVGGCLSLRSRSASAASSSAPFFASSVMPYPIRMNASPWYAGAPSPSRRSARA